MLALVRTEERAGERARKCAPALPTGCGTPVSSPGVEWLSRHRSVRNDALAALAFAALWFGAIWAGRHLGSWYPSPRWSWRLAGVFTVGVLLLREMFPRSAFWAAVVVYPVVYGALGMGVDRAHNLISEFHLLPVALAAYTVTARGRLKTWVVLLTAWAATGGLFLGAKGMTSILSRWDWASVDVSGLVVLEVAVAAIVLAGRAVYRQETANRSARRRNELLRRAETEQVVSAERTRIARELHDLVAHHISAVVIRAQAADRVADAHPDELREAVRWIAANGQETLAAMRHVVRVLRSAHEGAEGDEGAELAPQATLAALPEIAERMAAVGLPVTVVRPGPGPGDLPAAVELAAVRIVQEALTNVLVHAHATRAVVEIHAEAGALRLEIHDDGTAGSPPTAPIEIVGASPPPKLPSSRRGGGHGLIGMRERATSTGGTLRLGTSPLGGWLVTAVLRVERIGPVPEMMQS